MSAGGNGGALTDPFEVICGGVPVDLVDSFPWGVEGGGGEGGGIGGRADGVG
jgi:hypothetical protein